MSIIYKLFKQDPESRDGIISVTSGLGIFVNVVLSLMKILVGVMVSSIAIISEGINNAADVLSALLTLVGTKLAGKHPDENHPFGYGRIEYLASLIVSVLILVTGAEMIKSSIELIFHPKELNISVVSLCLIAASALVKLFLGNYTIKMGNKAGSNALVGVGVDARADSYASIITIVSALIFLIFHISVDAYAGVIMSILILKAGYELMKETVADLIGRPGEHDLAVKLYKEIRSTEGIISAVDMMLHNYGPDAWSGSVNVEIDHEKTVGEVYQFLHDLQLRIMHEYNVTMVFGVYAVANDHESTKELRKNIASFVRGKELVKSYHAVYVDEDEHQIYCDFIVDYKLQDWDGLQTEFKSYMKALYPDFSSVLTIETEFV